MSYTLPYSNYKKHVVKVHSLDKEKARHKYLLIS